MTLDAAPVEVLPGPSLLDAIPEPAAAPAPDEAPKRKSRSGTSGAERARRARAASGTPPRDRKPAAPKAAPLEKRLAEALDTVGLLVGSFVDPYDGAVLQHNAPACARVLAGIAERRPGFARLLENLLGVSTNIDGLALLVGVCVPILVHHGVIPAKFSTLAKVMGTEPPAGAAEDAAALRAAMAAAAAPVVGLEVPAA